MSSAQLALVTGASGYLGTEAVLAFKAAGFRVRGTVRQPSQIADFYTKFPEHKDHVEFVIVEHVDAPGAFNQAMKGVDVVAHTAQPTTLGKLTDNDADMLRPAINGTLSLLKSAAEKNVHSVVLTSSIASHTDTTRLTDPSWVMSSETWNPITFEEAVKSNDGQVVYYGAKTLAERAAWQFMENQKPSFSLTTIAPTWILGPSNAPSTTSIRNGRSSYTLSGQMTVDVNKAMEYPGLSTFVDVRDCALALVKAVTTPAAAGKRYLLISGEFSHARIAQILRASLPQYASRIPEMTDAEAVFPPHPKFDTKAAELDLGFKYTPLEKTAWDWGTQVLSLPK